MRGAVSVQGVGKAYGDVVALHDVSLDVRPGEFLTLLGPSGCGKTTLLRLLAGFETPDAGRILISGEDVAGWPPYRRPVNTVFQHYALFPHRTVAGNVAFGLEDCGIPPSEIAARVSRALEMVRLTGLGERRIDQLSGGQKQRVALARAVVLEPDVLLLDEPTANLDPYNVGLIESIVREQNQQRGTTVVLVTHNVFQARRLAARCALLLDGRIVETAPTHDFFERPRDPRTAAFVRGEMVY